MGKMSKKKINILIVIIFLMCSFFMSVCIVKVNSSLSNADSDFEKIILDKNKEYDEQTKDLISTENAINSNNNSSNSTVAYTDFLTTYKAALKNHQNADQAYMHFEGGVSNCAAVDCPVVGTISMVDTINGYYIRNKAGQELFYYDMTGTASLPSIAKDYYPNENYTMIYHDAPVYYEINTSDSSVINNTKGKFSSMSEISYLETYKNPMDNLFYTINENTIKEEIYFLQASNSSSVISAKVVLNTDVDVANGTATASATDLYSHQINELTGFGKKATSKNLELTFTFTSDAKLMSISVKESLTLYFVISDFTQEISVDNTYTMFFDYKKEKAISVSL